MGGGAIAIIAILGGGGAAAAIGGGGSAIGALLDADIGALLADPRRIPPLGIDLSIPPPLPEEPNDCSDMALSSSPSSESMPWSGWS